MNKKNLATEDSCKPLVQLCVNCWLKNLEICNNFCLSFPANQSGKFCYTVFKYFWVLECNWFMIQRNSFHQKFVPKFALFKTFFSQSGWSGKLD